MAETSVERMSPLFQQTNSSAPCGAGGRKPEVTAWNAKKAGKELESS